MDVLYPIGSGSKYNDLELKYSLRSLEKYLSGYDRIFIVGNLPNWIKKDSVVHIPKGDGLYKQQNIFLKIKAAIDNGISNNFLFFNDDHFLLQPLQADQLPYFYDNTLQHWATKARGRYKGAILNTGEGLYYDVHTPIIYNGEKFLNTVGKLDWSKEYVIKSAYCNANQIGKIVKIDDIKIEQERTVEQLKAIIHKKMFFSIATYALYPAMKQLLNELYPEKSKYEK